MLHLQHLIHARTTLFCLSFALITQVCQAQNPLMRWILLETGQMHGSCTSTTNCDENLFCYALQYIPDTSGTLTSYTTGFFVNCNAGANPIVSNMSCVMTSNSGSINGCAEFDLVLFNSSGNQGNLTVTSGVPLILHQVCFSAPETGMLTVTEDDVTDLTTSITLSSGMAVTEFPNYDDYIIDASVECEILPLTWLSFSARRTGETTAQLEWITTDEIGNAQFEIQRMTPANTDMFYPIGHVDAVQHPSVVNTYTFLDHHAHRGNNYYRILQRDYDGRTSLSPIRVVQFDADGFGLLVHPNPAKDRVLISVRNASSGGTMHLVDLYGRNVWQREFTSGSSQFWMSGLALPPGIYTLLTDDGGQRHSEKIIFTQ